jgi:hypothetical protein
VRQEVSEEKKIHVASHARGRFWFQSGGDY